MNNFVKSALLVVGLLACTSMAAMAGIGLRGAKGSTTINNSATAVEVCTGRCTVFSVLVSTGATTDFAVLRDSNTANTASSAKAYVVHSSSADVQRTFDPPLLFRNGVSFNCPSTSPYCTVVYASGVSD